MTWVWLLNLEKQNIRLKPEMTGYLSFSPRQIIRLPRYLLTFGFRWTRPLVHPPWYQWHNCSSNMTRIQALFWLGNTSNRQGLLLRSTSHFLFRARILWRSAICKLAMRWYLIRMCTRWRSTVLVPPSRDYNTHERPCIFVIISRQPMLSYFTLRLTWLLLFGNTH